MHPNPRLYKYYWWIFHAGSPAEGATFLEPAFRVTTYAAHTVIARLTEESEPYLMYNQRLPRRSAGSVLSPQATRWCNCEWAVAFYDDPDPEIDGHR